MQRAVFVAQFSVLTRRYIGGVLCIGLRCKGVERLFAFCLRLANQAMVSGMTQRIGFGKRTNGCIPSVFSSHAARENSIKEGLDSSARGMVHVNTRICSLYSVRSSAKWEPALRLFDIVGRADALPWCK